MIQLIPTIGLLGFMYIGSIAITKIKQQRYKVMAAGNRIIGRNQNIISVDFS